MNALLTYSSNSSNATRIGVAVLEQPRGVAWDEIAGLEHAKAVVQEVAVWPLLAPTLFRGARAVPRGLLLFGPPGTGKARWRYACAMLHITIDISAASHSPSDSLS